MRVVILGAGGFVGGWLCEELSVREDIDLVACVRKWASACRLARRGLNIVRADLQDSDELAAAFTDADAVINSAMPEPAREPELCLNAYRIAANAGVRTFIQLSSAVVYGEQSGEIDESAPTRPVSDYARGKVETESTLRRVADEGGPKLFIFRPSIVYGPFAEVWTIGFAQRISAGRWRGLGRHGTGTANLIHGRDIAAAALAALSADVDGRSHTLNLNGPDIVSWNEYIERFGNALGVADRDVPNIALVGALAVGAEGLRRGNAWLKAHNSGLIARVRKAPLVGETVFRSSQSMVRLYPSFGEMKLMRRKVRYSAAAAVATLGFATSTSLDEGLSESAEWCRLHGVL